MYFMEDHVEVHRMKGNLVFTSKLFGHLWSDICALQTPQRDSSPMIHNSREDSFAPKFVNKLVDSLLLRVIYDGCHVINRATFVIT